MLEWIIDWNVKLWNVSQITGEILDGPGFGDSDVDMTSVE